jgi:hypothetical protein
MSDPAITLPISGNIDLYGYLENASGWLFVGWLSRRGVDRSPLQVTARFTHATVVSDAAAMFYERADVHAFGVGVIVFVASDEDDAGMLEAFQFGTDTGTQAISLSRSINKIPSDRIHKFLSGLLARSEPLGDDVAAISIIQRLIPSEPSALTEADAAGPSGPVADTTLLSQQLPGSLSALAADRPASSIAGGFDEEAYLRENPKVAEAIAKGHLPNAAFHYRLFGAQPLHVKPAWLDTEVKATSDREPEIGRAEPGPTRAVSAEKLLGPASIDALIVSITGACFLIGWVDDRRAPLERISIEYESGAVTYWPGETLARFRRSDAETALGIEHACHLGFCGFFNAAPRRDTSEKPRLVRLSTSDGASGELSVAAKVVGDIELRDIVLGYLSGLEFAGNKDVEYFYTLDNHLGDALIRYNRLITQSIVSACQHRSKDASVDGSKNASRRAAS